MGQRFDIVVREGRRLRESALIERRFGGGDEGVQPCAQTGRQSGQQSTEDVARGGEDRFGVSPRRPHASTPNLERPAPSAPAAGSAAQASDFRGRHRARADLRADAPFGLPSASIEA